MKVYKFIEPKLRNAKPEKVEFEQVDFLYVESSEGAIYNIYEDVVDGSIVIEHSFLNSEDRLSMRVVPVSPYKLMLELPKKKE